MTTPINPALVSPSGLSFAVDVGGEKETKTNDLEWLSRETNDENCYLRPNNKVVNVTAKVINETLF